MQTTPYGIKFYMQYAKFMVLQRSQTSPGRASMFYNKNASAFNGYFYKDMHLLKDHEDRLILAHDGMLTAKQSRRWGPNAFKTAGAFKTVDVPKPANIYPCSLLALDVSKSSEIPLESLNIGIQNDVSNRHSVTDISRHTIGWIKRDGPDRLRQNELFQMWDYHEKNGVDSVIPELFRDEHMAWRRTRSMVLIPDSALETSRKKNTQWGAW